MKRLGTGNSWGHVFSCSFSPTLFRLWGVFQANPCPESSHGLVAAVCFIGGEAHTPPQALEEAKN